MEAEPPKVQDIVFVAVKEEPHDEDSMPPFPAVELKEEEFKHEETEITDVHLPPEEACVQAPPANFSQVFIQTRDSSEVLTASPPPAKRIKEEIQDPPEVNSDESSQTSSHTSTMPFSCIICEETFVTPKDVNEHSKTVHNFSCCEYCLENFRRYSCSFKGNICTHEYKGAEATVTTGEATVTTGNATVTTDMATVTTDMVTIKTDTATMITGS